MDLNSSYSTGGGFVKSEGGDGGSETKSGGRNHKTAIVHLDQIRRLFTDTQGLIIHQHRITHVEVVARLITIEDNPQRNIYTVQDHTGPPMTVQFWKGDESRSVPKDLQEGLYVRIFGQPKKQPDANEPFLAAFGMALVTPNEMTLHLIERIYSSMVLEKKKNNMLAGLTPMANFPGSDSKPDFLAGQPINQGHSSHQAASMHTSTGMSQAQSIVLKAISECHTNAGIHIGELQNSIKGLNKDQLRKALDFLAQEGHIYSTVDEEHFKATDG
ncbi:Replication protein A 32 kDa subunit-B [Halotydeus destructor]|nr:Replication protein A 32 kDa subunit-B [Halotydeus destructor]